MKPRIDGYRAILLPALLGALLVLAACGGGGEEPTATPTKTPMATDAAPTATPQPPAAAQPTPAAADQTDAPAPTEPAAATSTPVVERVATVATDLLNIRTEPSTSGTIVRTAATGESFTVFAESDDGQWVQVGEDGEPLGWAAAEFLTIEERVVEPTDTPAGGETAQPTQQSQSAPPVVDAGNCPPATMTSPDYGAQIFVWWRDEIRDRDLDLMRDAGFDWVKQTFAWETIEGAGNGQFDWSRADQVVSHACQRGLKVLARLSIDPQLTSFWAGPPPGNADAFAEYAYEVANRYNCQPGAVGCVQAFQVWNEPNLAREWGGARPNPAEYAEFLRKTYAAIKRANPNALVISAGMAPTGDNNDAAMPDDLYYDELYQAMGGNSNGYFDLLGVHGAGYAAEPELDPAEAASNQKYGGYRFFAFRHVEDIRDIMVKYGDNDKRIALLEFGWTYDPVNAAYKWHGADAGITNFVQADYLKRAYQYAAQNWPWVGLMNLLTMPNLDWTTDGNPEDEEQFWWAIMEPSPVERLYFRPAYVELCIYLNGLKGQACPYDPNK